MQKTRKNDSKPQKRKDKERETKCYLLLSFVLHKL